MLSGAGCKVEASDDGFKAGCLCQSVALRLCDQRFPVGLRRWNDPVEGMELTLDTGKKADKLRCPSQRAVH